MTKLITIGNQELIRVGRDYPCPICGKPDWCLVFADQSKAVCARKIDPDKPQFGSAGTIYDLDTKDSNVADIDIITSLIMQGLYKTVMFTCTEEEFSEKYPTDIVRTVNMLSVSNTINTVFC